ncbi:FecR family protein [Sphingobacterium sp. BIGb0165]|uniref:FecR family protein n=1 Tax=Sphingobacterium sp. BIGb0165 TaxID=2940615 RepID=UPI00216A3D15|nr:FecR domain-containing protein [Sphingobacterium sp. BIGb0165]MCS4229001.1 ferric-dicitrate binding protein FerR (iron transport regulator) [Sphingobacterium sp. BIGb0165]
MSQKDYKQLEDFLIDDTFQKYCSGEDKNCILYWQQYCLNHPEQVEMILKAKRLYQILVGNRKSIHEQMERLKTDLQNTPIESAPIRQITWQKWGAIAAVFAALVGGGLWYYSRPTNAIAPQTITNVGQVYQTKKGEKKTFELIDGSTVTLNSASKLELSSDFNGELRLVRLVGEGYFQVAKNKEKPFMVQASDFDIKVLGTTFNVKSYPEEPTAEALLVEGSIEMKSKGQRENSVVIKPNQKITIFKNQTELAVNVSKGNKPTLSKLPIKEIAIENIPVVESNTTEIPDIAWKENRLEIVDQDFESLRRTLERWYDVDIQLQSEELKSYRFTATFSKENITQVLSALQKVEPFKFELYGKKITISEK